MYAVRWENVQTETITNTRAGAVNMITGFQALQTEMESSLLISTKWMVETKSCDQWLEPWIASHVFGVRLDSQEETEIPL